MDMRVAAVLATSELKTYNLLLKGVAFYRFGHNAKFGYTIISHEGDELERYVPAFEIQMLVARLRQLGIEPGRIPGYPGSCTYGWK